MIPTLYIALGTAAVSLATGLYGGYQYADGQCAKDKLKAAELANEAIVQSHAKYQSEVARGDTLSAKLSKAKSTISGMREDHEDHARTISGQCPDRLRLVHDAAALGIHMPATPGALVGATKTIAASEVGVAVARNYATCREQAEQLNALIDWHKREEK